MEVNKYSIIILLYYLLGIVETIVCNACNGLVKGGQNSFVTTSVNRPLKSVDASFRVVL